MPHVNKKPLGRKRIFVKHHFLTTSRVKKFHAAKSHIFRSTFCFGVTKITTPIWYQKSWEFVNRSWKNHSTTSPEAQFKEFSLTKQKTGPRTDYECIEKTISKIISNKKKQKIKVKMPHVNKKPLARKGNLVQSKKPRPRMYYEWIGTTKKKIWSKIWKKTLKTKVKLPHVKASFCSNTIFSL